MNRGVSVEADNQARLIGEQASVSGEARGRCVVHAARIVMLSHGGGAWGKGSKQVIGIGFDHAIKLGHV